MIEQYITLKEFNENLEKYIDNLPRDKVIIVDNKFVLIDHDYYSYLRNLEEFHE